MEKVATSYTFWCLFLGCLAATVVLTPMVSRLAFLLGAVDGGGHRKVYQGKPIPRLGGLAIALPFIAACLFGIYGWTDMVEAVAERKGYFGALAAGCVGIVVLGMFDDSVGIRARWKLMGQIAIAAFMCVAGRTITVLELPFVGTVPLGMELGTVVTILWIVGLINAFNLVDGIDGLASGIALIAAVSLGVFAVGNGSLFPALLCAALAGSLIGFLIFNFNPARIFLGDTGSMLLGFVLANIALLGSLKGQSAAVLLTPLLIMGLPVLDMTTSMLRRYLRGRPIFSGDQGHIHHRMLNRGYSTRKAVGMLYLFAAIMAASALAASQSSGNPVKALGIASYVAATVGLIWMCGFLTPTSMNKLRQGRQRNTMLNAFTRYTVLKLDTLDMDHPSEADHILWLICKEMRLRRLEVTSNDGERLLFHERPGRLESDVKPHYCRVQNRSGHMLHVRYIADGLPEGLEPTDVEACLARILEEANLRLVRTVPQFVAQSQDVRLTGTQAG